MIFVPALIRRPAPSGKTSPFLPSAYSLRNLPRDYRNHHRPVGFRHRLDRVVDHLEALDGLGLDADVSILRQPGSARTSIHRSAPAAGTIVFRQFHDQIRLSHVPLVHVLELPWRRHVGGFPFGAPPSTHLPIVAISSSVSDASFLKLWMPTFLSMYQGGISRSTVRCLIALAQESS